jgi:hypothetical protein
MEDAQDVSFMNPFHMGDGLAMSNTGWLWRMKLDGTDRT